MSKQIISREEARAAGLGRFFTGEPCLLGEDVIAQQGHVLAHLLAELLCVSGIGRETVIAIARENVHRAQGKRTSVSLSTLLLLAPPPLPGSEPSGAAAVRARFADGALSSIFRGLCCYCWKAAAAARVVDRLTRDTKWRQDAYS